MNRSIPRPKPTKPPKAKPKLLLAPSWRSTKWPNPANKTVVPASSSPMPATTAIERGRSAWRCDAFSSALLADSEFEIALGPVDSLPESIGTVESVFGTAALSVTGSLQRAVVEREV